MRTPPILGRIGSALVPLPRKAEHVAVAVAITKARRIAMKSKAFLEVSHRVYQ